MAKKNQTKDTRQAVRKPCSLWKKIAVILVCAIVVGLALSVALYYGNPTPTYASVELQMSFDGAADGKAPSGTVFNVNDLSSNEVIEAALKASSLDEAYTPEQIRSALVITGQYPEDLAKQTMSYDSLLDFTANRTLTVAQFHPTLFRVTLYNYFDPHISRAKLSSILNNLLEEYKTHFASEYALGLPNNSNSSATFNLSEYDYPQQMQILQMKLQIISSYAEEMYLREPLFRYGGSSFSDIVARIESIQDSDIGRLTANMTLNALTKNPERLATQYEFELQDLNNQLIRRREQIKSIDSLIDSYEKSEIIYISTADSLTKIDGNSSETYDKLVDIRKDIALSITTINSQLEDYRIRLLDLTGEEYDVISDSESDEDITVGDSPTVGTTIGVDAGDENDEPGTITNNNENIIGNVGSKRISGEELKQQRESFEAEVSVLEEKCDAVIGDFSAMVKAWNESKLNDLTVTVSGYRYSAPSLLSGAFIVSAIKTAGPIVALAVIVCLCMIIVAKKREETEEHRNAAKA